MYRIATLNPYTAEVDGLFLTQYKTEEEAVSEMMAMIEDVKTYPYNDPYLYAVYKNHTATPVLVGGYSGHIQSPIPEFSSSWRTIKNRLIEDYLLDADFMYQNYYTVDW